MSGQAPRSFLSSVLIGRASQLEYFRQLLASDGGPRNLVISGEAGIGKSRLVLEAKKLTAQAGASVLQGNCFERDAALPYSAVTDLLRGSLLELPTEVLEPALDLFGPEIVKLVPEVSARNGAIVPTAHLDGEQERRRIFHALTQLLIHLARMARCW